MPAVDIEQTEDDRTNALGLFNFAHSYWSATVVLQNAKIETTHPEGPIDYLTYHSIELYLKSFLRLRGYTLAKVIHFGHKILKLYDAAIEEGLEKDVETRRVIAMIEKNYKSSRYIRTGRFNKASSGGLWGVCYMLHTFIEPEINKYYILDRERNIPELNPES